MRVLELSTTISGPYCGMILAELGADVIKVERPERGDDARSMPPHLGSDSAVFDAVNRGKRSIVLDLAQATGREVFLALAARADVVVQNFRPGVVARLGLDHARVRAVNPRAVYCSVSAFGAAGSAAGLAGYDPLIQAFVGMMSLTGEPGRPPVRAAASVVDLTTGMWAAMGIMAALNRRDRTGVGEHVEITMVDSGFALLCHQILGMVATGEVPEPLGSASPITAPYEAFEAADGWVLIAAGNDRLFRRLCEALGCAGLAADPRFGDSAARVRNRAELHAAIQDGLAGLSRARCLELLREAGVPAGPVHALDEALRHPIVAERELVADVGAALPQVRLPISAPGRPPRRPPRLGEHTEEILREIGA